MAGKVSPQQYPHAANRGQIAATREMPAEYLATIPDEELLRAAWRESVRRIMWTMDRGASQGQKLQAAALLAKICTPKPPQRVEHSGTDGGPMEMRMTLRNAGDDD